MFARYGVNVGAAPSYSQIVTPVDRLASKCAVGCHDFARKRYLPLQWSHESSRCNADAHPGLGWGALRWLSTGSMISRGFRASAPAISAPIGSAACSIRRDVSAVRRTTTTTTSRSCEPSTSCCARVSTPPTSPSSSPACDKAPIWPTSWASSAPSLARAPTSRQEPPQIDSPPAVDIDPDCDEARRLLDYGLAELDRRRGGAGRHRRWPRSWRAAVPIISIPARDSANRSRRRESPIDDVGRRSCRGR